MNPRAAHCLLKLACSGGFLVAASVALGQLTISHSTFEPGTVSTSGALSMTSVVGQPEAAGQSQNGFDRVLHGFLQPADPVLQDSGILDFTVTDEGDGQAPRLTWMTASEPSLLGFDIYRAVDVGGGYELGERLTTTPVTPTGSVGTGASYEFLDPAVFNHGSGDRTYTLVAIDASARGDFYGAAVLADPGSLDPGSFYYLW